MAKFKIGWRDPNTGNWCEEVGEFDDIVDAVIKSPGGKQLGIYSATARDAAEDYAYTRADKGPHEVTEIK
tara:strand:- start:82360 stop:82569 length:210 start_codon:yes stop_codon:yes gene_type:complete